MVRLRLSSDMFALSALFHTLLMMIGFYCTAKNDLK